MFGWFGGGSKEIEWEYKELPTCETDEDYQRVSEELFNEFMDLFKSTDNWTTLSTDDNIVFEEQTVEGSSAHRLRTKGEIQGVTPEELHKFMWDGTLEDRQKLVPEITEWEVIREITPELRIGRSVFRQTGITDREMFVIRCSRKLESGAYVLWGSSVNIKSEPFNPSRVRAVSKIGSLIEPIDGNPNAVRLTAFDLMDPKGSIPGFLVSLGKKKPFERVQKLRKLYAK